MNGNFFKDLQLTAVLDLDLSLGGAGAGASGFHGINDLLAFHN